MSCPALPGGSGHPRKKPGGANADVEELEMDRAGRNLHVHTVALLAAQQRLRDRRADRQLAFAQIRLVLGDDRVGHLLLVVVVQKRHLAQNLHFALVDLRLVDHAGVGHRILQFGDTHLQQPLCLTGGIVLRILRKVALVARFGDRRRNRRTLDGTHVLEFVLDFLVALRCQINNLLCHNPITLRNLPPEAGNSKNRIKRKK